MSTSRRNFLSASLAVPVAFSLDDSNKEPKQTGLSIPKLAYRNARARPA